MGETIYYPGPTQVRYWDTGIYHSGIAFHDYIVDVANGEPHKVMDIISRAPFTQEEDAGIIEYGDWKDLSYNFTNKRP